MRQFALGFAACITLVSCLSWAAVANLDVERFAGSVLVRVNDLPVRAGSGKPASVVRDAGTAFDRIVLRSAENLDVRIGPEASITLHGDDNLLELIETRIDGGRLMIESRGSYRSKTPLRVEVQLPSLRAFALEGSADARIRGVTGKALEIELNGSGNITASGSVENLDVDLNGSGDASLGGLKAVRVEADLNGSGDITVAASEALEAELNGSGDIRYHGSPARLRMEVNGSGDIERAD